MDPYWIEIFEFLANPFSNLTVLLLLVWYFGVASLSGWLAREKGYNGTGWFFLALGLSLIVLLALIGAPMKRPSIS